MLSLEVIGQFAELLQLKTEWSQLLESSPEVTPFQLPAWLLTWWRHFGGSELHTFVFRNSSKLVGIIPCFRHEWEGKRQLTLLGSGISDYLEPAIGEAHHAEAMNVLAEFLRRDRDWDICNWQDLNVNTPLQLLTSGDEFTVSLQPDTDCAETIFRGGFGQWYERRPHGLRRNVRRYLERARSIGEPEFCVIREAEPELVEALIALHAARWQKRGESGMIARNCSALFLREVLASFAARDMLRFFILRFRGEVAAVIAAFPYRNALFSYLSAFDPQYEQLGFGRILLYYSLRHAFQLRYQSWNFLRGSEPYKFDWGARRIPKCRVIVTRNA